MKDILNPKNILYEDNHLIVVYKHFNILTQSDQTGNTSLFDQVKKYIKIKYHKPGKVFLGLVHRLDRPVAGIIIFAKTSKAASRLSKQFREHTIRKKYLALVEGKLRVGEKQTLINHISKNHQTNKVKITNQPHPNSKKAILEFEAVEIKSPHIKLFSLPKSIINSSLLFINLITGRSHQIRAQLAHLGYPIIGDTKYGSSYSVSRHICLIAHELTLRHPTTKQILTFCIKK